MKQGDIIALKLKDVDGRSDPLHVCHVWYNSAFNQLELSDGLGKPRIHVIQVAAILTLCNSHFGEGYREMNLFNIAINAARSLKMHRLGTESSFPSGIQIIPEWSTQANRELGRRLWWTIVICDW